MSGCVQDAADPARWYFQARLKSRAGPFGNAGELERSERDWLARQSTALVEVGRDATGLDTLARCRGEPELAGFRLFALAQSVRHEPMRMRRFRDAGFFKIVLDRIVNAPQKSTGLYVRRGRQTRLIRSPSGMPPLVPWVSLRTGGNLRIVSPKRRR